MDSPIENILKNLNQGQRAAVTTTAGPVLVIAGPGSGKTRALTHRVAYLIAAGAPAAAILAVTFTNKAAGEMRARVAALLRGNGENGEIGESAAEGDLVRDKQFHQAQRFTKRSDLPSSTSLGPFIGTFHSFAAHLLRREAGKIGFRPNFTIYDEGDALTAVKELMRELGMSPERIPPAMASAVISRLKTDLVGAEEYAAERGDPFGTAMARLYRAYQERLRLSNAMDFDDLIFHAVRLLRADPKTRRRWQERFRFIHVDEYQDTNPSQYELIRLLAGAHQNLFVIGDDAQAIYGWRGADYRNILRFEQDWPKANVIFLEENYRSTPEILATANRLIGKNRDQKPKSLFTKNPAGDLPRVSAHEHERAEAEFIANEVNLLCRERGLSWRECAVLYRTNAQSRALEEAMLERGIPYAIIGAVPFFQRREVKDLVAYLRYLENPDDALALKRIVNVPPRGIGPKTFLALLAGKPSSESSALLLGERKGLADRERRAIRHFAETTAALRASMGERSLADFLRFLIKAIGYDGYLDDGSPEADSRRENIRELVTVARRYDALPIGEAITRLAEEGALASAEDDLGDDDRVRLMTLHSAKGLEFPAVFMAGLEEGLLPHAKSIQNGRAELEEERRLCYVGMTRAKKRLYLTWALSRTLFGELQVNMPSRFLRELPREILETSRTEMDDLLIAEE